MNLKINRNMIVDKFLLILIYLQLVILEFYGFDGALNKIITVLILIRIFSKRGKKNQSIIICLAGLVFLFLLSVLMSNAIVFSIAKSNFLMQFYPMVYAYYFYYVCKNNSQLIDELLKNGFWIFNTTILINIVVLYMQITNPFSVNAVIPDGIPIIDYYEDTISGLFAYASTHNVCLFTIFVVLYDLSFRDKIANKITRNMLLVYIIFISFVSFIIATYNDNKAFFLMFPLALTIWYFIKPQKNILLKTRKTIIALSATTLVLGGLYAFYKPFSSFVAENIFSTTSMILVAISMGNNAFGSNERIAIIEYALKLPSTWLFGEGFGSNGVYTSGLHGFKHFGQADMGSMLMLGGLWYTVLMFVYYIKISRQIILGGIRKNEKILTLGLFVLWFCVAGYTQCFTRTSTIICMMLIMVTFRYNFQARER